MGSLDDFVETHVKQPKEWDMSTDDFRLSGGQAIIINPEGDSKWVGLGVFSKILECFDGPVDPSKSNTMRMILDTYDKNEIFHHQTLEAEAARGGIVQWTPVDSYEQIKEAAQNLHEKYGLLKKVLGDHLTGHYPNIIETAIDNIRKAESSEKMMHNIFLKSTELGKLISYIPLWASNSWFIELPEEYQAVSEAYKSLRKLCRESKYQISVPKDLQNNVYLHWCQVEEVADNRRNIVIVDDAKALEAFSKLGCVNRNVIYRESTDKTAALVEKIGAKNLVICENLKGPNEYKQWLARNDTD
jgi:hypothetical protein